MHGSSATGDLLEGYPIAFGDLILEAPISVPLNQRPWEWRSTELDDLFDDLTNTTDRWCQPTADGKWEMRRDTASLLPYFFGPLVLETDSRTGERALVDGQQRCTATTVLVAVMRDQVESLCNDPASSVLSAARALRVALMTWLMADPNSGSETPRLALDETVADFFDHYVIRSVGAEERSRYLAELRADPLGDSEDVRKALVDATEHLSERLSSHLAERHPDANPAQILSRIQALFGTLSKAFLTIAIEVRRTGMAPQLFAGLNARGTPLNEADKIKNELFLFADSEDHGSIKLAWDAMAKTVPDRDTESFLRMRHIAFIDDTKQIELYRNVRRKSY